MLIFITRGYCRLFYDLLFKYIYMLIFIYQSSKGKADQSLIQIHLHVNLYRK